MKHQSGRIGARLQLRLRIFAIALAVVVREGEWAVEGAGDGAAVHAKEGVQVCVAGNQATEGSQITI
jgi:hypothetical protein